MKKRLILILCILLMILIAVPVSAIDIVAISGSIYRTDLDYYNHLRGEDITLVVYNWGEYISDGGDDSFDTNKEFEELTGISINYITFASNEQMYAKLKSEGTSLYDIIIPSDYMIARMIREGMVEALDFSNIPNYTLVDDLYKNLEHDRNNEFSVPYMWGLVGIIYNSSMVDEDIDSWDSFWDEQYKGNILMFDNPRDAFAISLARLGYSMNTEDESQIEEAAEELMKQKSLVQAYVMDEIFNKMEGGEAAIAPYYAGDAITMMSENEDLVFVFPKEKTNLFIDGFVIPKGSKNKEAAEMYINFMCEPAVSAANAEYIGYSTPIPDAFELIDIDDEDLAIAYPNEKIIANSEVLRELNNETNLLMDRLWTDIRSYKDGTKGWIIPTAFILAAVIVSTLVIIRRAKKRRRDLY
ncbi:MAG: spermidine/putrescine ABC transporter substrate-binding protein [Oscillospiraceae bacterium]|nr:spermidine/putrescine ABC transporter substrate-binding protein [Oscillospiraceae bacterium]